MQAGDIFIRSELRGEPQKLLTYWRGLLGDALPLTALVKIKREVPFDRIWSWRDGVYFAPMNRTEKKRAELSISEASLTMSADEIADARFLTDALYGWLSRRTGIPDLDRKLSGAQIYLQADGGLEILDAIEQFSDQELVGSFTVGIAYMQGVPRKPTIRFLPGMSDIKTKIQLDEMQYFESLLTDEQAARLKNTFKRVADIFRKRMKARKALVSEMAQKALGIGVGGIRFHDRAVTDDMLMGYQYRELIAWLKHEEEAKTKSKRV